MSKVASKLTKLYTGEDAARKEIGEAKDWNIQTQKGTIDVSKLGTEWKEFLVGQSSWTASMSLWYDPSDEAQEALVNDALEGTEIVLAIHPQGTGVDKPEWAGRCFITDWNPSGATESAVGVAISIQGNGELKRTKQTV